MREWVRGEWEGSGVREGGRGEESGWVRGEWEGECVASMAVAAPTHLVEGDDEGGALAAEEVDGLDRLRLQPG